MVDFTKPVYGSIWANSGEKLPPDQNKIAMGWIQEMMPYQYENYLQNRTDVALSYLLQKGIAEWSAEQEYTANKSVVTYGGQLYMATATVTNILPTVAASWKKLSATFGANGAIPIAFGGTGATTATDARTNLGIGSAATVDLPTTNGIVAKLANNSLVARTITGTAGYITVTNGDAVSGNPTITVGENVAKTDADAAWSTKTSIKIPSGTSSERGVGAPGRIRFNMESGVYEGYDNAGWNPIGSTGILDVQNFSGDGVKTSFTMSATPRAENNTQVYFNGVYQQKNSYNLVGSDLVFDEAPALGIEIEVVTVSSVAIGTTTATQTSIVDSGNYYNSTNVEGALAEIGNKQSHTALSYATKAEAVAAAATLPDGQVVEAPDSDGYHTQYVVQGAALVVKSKFGQRSDSLLGSNSFQPEGIYQNNAATPLGLLIKLNAESSVDGAICQDMVYDRVRPALYVTWSTADGTVITEHSSVGAFRRQSATVPGEGHGQGFGMFHDATGAVNLVMESSDRKGVTFFKPTTSDGGNIVDPVTFLLNKDSRIVYPCIASGSRYLTAIIRLGVDNYIVRGYYLTEMLAAGGGDFSDKHFYEFPILPANEYGEGNVIQGIADGGEFIYILTGESGQSSKKFLSCFNKLNGKRIYRVEIVTGKALAQARNTTTYELEGLEWVADASGNHSLWTIVVVRRAGGVGYDMVAAPIDARGFGSLGTITPLGGAGLVLSSTHDLLIRDGERLTISRQSGVDPENFPALWEIGSDDRVYSNSRHRLGVEAEPGIVPETFVRLGMELKPDLGRLSLGANTVALQAQTVTAGPLLQFYYNTSYVGHIDVREEGTRYYTTRTVWFGSGAGSPEGVITAPVGCQWTRTDATGSSNVFYVKATGTGNTGWVAK